MRQSIADKIQKTWTPEGTKEYSFLKFVTQENAKLIEVISEFITIKDGDLVLDVGGRDGAVSFALQKPQWVHIVDPDPTTKPVKKPAKFWNKKVQDVLFSKLKYKLIICDHVLGYLGLQEVQEEVLRVLTGLLAVGGTLVLFYNTNTGYMKELIEFSRHILSAGHYDYFDEHLLNHYRLLGYEVKIHDVAFQIDYKTFRNLGKGCWFLFGAIDPDIEKQAAKFVPKLTNDLLKPGLILDERIVFITKREKDTNTPTLL